MKKIITYIFILINIPLLAQKYSSRKLAEIGDGLHKTCLPANDSIFNCPAIIKDKSLIVKYNSKNEVIHLGVSLFSREIKEMINFPVCNFIERFLLELIQQKSTVEIAKKLKEHNVVLEERKLTGDNEISSSILLSILSKMRQPTHFTLRQHNAKYIAVWKFGDYDILTMTFPVSRELIFGTNKKESDEALSELLPESYCDETQKESNKFSADEMTVTPYNNRIFERKGDFFINPKINSDIYCFRNSKGEFYPVYDDSYPDISLKNLFLMPQMNTNLKLHIKHHQYSNFTPEFEMKLDDFVCFFRTDANIYSHVETTKQDTLEIYVVVHSKKFNYIHMLCAKTNVNTVFQSTGTTIQAEFYSNIPQHNIKNLFSTTN
jgi:hypothetical protein